MKYENAQDLLPESLLTQVQKYISGKLEDWVHAFLLSDGHNKPFSDGLKLEPRIFLGPLRMPMHLMKRCCGPEKGLPFPVPQDAWDRHVAKLTQAILNDPDMPPLIVHYTCEDGKDIFTVNDGNTRYEAYTRLGRNEANVILWITDMPERQDDYGCFAERYPEYAKER